MLCTYLIMMVIPLTVFCIGVKYAHDEMKKEAFRYQEAVLRQASSVCDNILKQTQLAVYTLTVDDATSQLVRQNEWDGGKMFRVAELVNQLFGMKTSYDCLGSLGIYFHGNNSFVTEETRYPEPLHEAYLGQYGITVEQFRDMTDSYKGFFLLGDQEDRWLVLYQNVYNYSSKIRHATAYAMISCRGVEERLQYLDMLEGSSIFIADGAGNLVAGTDHDVVLPWLSEEEWPVMRETGNGIMISDESASLLEMRSAEWDIYYGMYLEKAGVYDKVHLFTIYCAIAVVLILVVGIVLAVYFTQKTNAPVDYLLSMIDSNRQKYTGIFMTESFRILEDRLLQLKKDLQQLNRQADSYDVKMLETSLQGFLEGIYPDDDWILNLQDKEERLQNIEEYRIVLFCFSQMEDSRFIKNQKASRESYSLLFFSLKNVVDEVFWGLEQIRDAGISLTMDDRIACIVPLNQDSGQEDEESIAEKAESCINFFREIFELRSYATVSGRHSALMDLSVAYREACMTVTQVEFWEKEEKVSFFDQENGKEEPIDGRELLQLKKQISGCLIMSDYGKARELMEKIVDNCFSKDIRYLSYNQCQAYSLIGMILDKLGDDGIQEQRKVEYSSRLLQTHSVRELRSEIDAVFDDIVKYREENVNEPEWVEQIKEYVQENYRNPDLSISYIAERFSMSPSHVGNRFRKQMGIGILDYIHMTRLQECRKLLAQGKTIRYCAEATGYTDVKTLQRAFKRYEGMGPGQYKEEVLKNEAPRDL